VINAGAAVRIGGFPGLKIQTWGTRLDMVLIQMSETNFQVPAEIGGSMKNKRGRKSVPGQMTRSPDLWFTLMFALIMSIVILTFGAVLTLRSVSGDPSRAHRDGMFLVMLWDVAQWGIFIKY
jgi:hypothetical protein